MASDKLQVLTFKAGLLSRIAHDLRLTVARFDIQTSSSDIEVIVDATSLQVDGPRRGDEVDPRGLSAADKDSILQTVAQKILRSDRYPEIRFVGTRSEQTVDGELTLVGQTRRTSLPYEIRSGRAIGEVELAPSHWGIPPYKAMLGAIQLQDRVLIRFDLAERPA